ncbi:alkaline phosphatase family protein [Mycobacterium basiliense]|uniref:alkaline phosphatase family protein n=1 Tax=Mycobacterium basiliense TaxID=2094119 RepID=UPI0038CC0A86
MHEAWNGGANDNWLPAQAAVSALPGNTPVTIGYYTRQDLPIHYLLADTFTVCDGYFCSLLGGTTRNRLYWISATVDPDCANGGPQLVEPFNQALQKFSWRTMPENLEDAGVSWKMYQNKLLGAINNTTIGYNGELNLFKQAGNPRSNLARNGIAPTYPGTSSPTSKTTGCPRCPGCFRDFCCPSIPRSQPTSVLLPSSTCSGSCCPTRRYGRKPR